MVLSVFPVPAMAAMVSLESEHTMLHVGDVVTVAVMADTEKQAINAVESVITFSSRALEFVSANDSHSVVSMWVEAPALRSDNVISFSGITPGGFEQSDAELVSLNFRVLQTGISELAFGTTSLLLNDGAGTESSLIVQNVSIEAESGDSRATSSLVDTDLPEPFTPVLFTDPDVFDGMPGIAFSTTDKGSGIDRYEVAEGFWGTYELASSPYRITHGDQGTAVYIKAVDHAGNERIEIFYPHNWQPWYQSVQMSGTIFILIGIVLFICLFLVLLLRFLRTGRFLFWR